MLVTSFTKLINAHLVLILISLAQLALPCHTHSQIYKYTDDKGTIHFTDNPKSSRFEPVNITSQFWVSQESNKYHYPTCLWAQKIKHSNLIKFSSPEEALKAGYIPCKVCNPPTTSKSGTEERKTNYPSPPETIGTTKIYCSYVIDGDSIVVKINGQEEKVRLIGVNTPELDHPEKQISDLAKKAKMFTKKMVEGKEVILEFDQQRRDEYERLLAYVYLLDGTFLNAEIIKQGYGYTYTKFPFKYLEEFRQFEKKAKNNKRGLWKSGLENLL
jgi:micrococcal nuclease